MRQNALRGAFGKLWSRDKVGCFNKIYEADRCELLAIRTSAQSSSDAACYFIHDRNDITLRNQCVARYDKLVPRA